MRVKLYSNTWWHKPAAAIIFFTRLPLYKLCNPPKEAYRHVVEFWPLAGWITGLLTALILWLASQIMPIPIAILIAIAFRMLLTGALHEDGLADFFDAFGASSDRQKILDIMKDSRIGTYGVLALIIYFLLLLCSLNSLPLDLAALTIAAADPFSKMIAAEIIMFLPYARNENEAKNGVVYAKMNLKASILLAIQGLIPFAAFCYALSYHEIPFDFLIFVPCLVMYILYLIIWKRIKGYTGDCCGAIFLLVELSFILTVSALYTFYHID